VKKYKTVPLGAVFFAYHLAGPLFFCIFLRAIPQASGSNSNGGRYCAASAVNTLITPVTR
jgi:hypothetical protein